MADITLGQFYNAIAQGAREATLDALKGTDFATQATLAAVLAKLSDDPATESTLDDILSKLSSDPSTATLQTAIKNAVDAVANKVATETTLSAAKGVLDTIAGNDFATQTTLAQVKQVLDALSGAVSTSAGQADIQQAIAALAGIVAKESTLGQAKGVLDAISDKVATDQGVGLVASAVEALAQIAATESTLSQAVQKLESIVSSLQQTLTVDGEVQLKGSKTRISSAPVVGVRTITSIAAELHAGAIRKAGRTLLMVRNLDPAVRVRVGPSTVSDRTGFGIEPEAVLTLAIDPASDVPIYAVSEAGAVQVEVLEA